MDKIIGTDNASKCEIREEVLGGRYNRKTEVQSILRCINSLSYDLVLTTHRWAGEYPHSKEMQKVNVNNLCNMHKVRNKILQYHE